MGRASGSDDFDQQLPKFMSLDINSRPMRARAVEKSYASAFIIAIYVCYARAMEAHEQCCFL